MITSTTSHYKSSTIKSATYDFVDKMLTIDFNWATYVYEAVDQDTWNKFNTAESQGKALNEFIKGKYEYDKLFDENVDVKYPKGSLLNELPPADYQLDN